MKQGYRNLFGFFVLTMVVLALVFVGQTSAQVISGDLVGTVLDKTGAAVPNANVEAVNAATGVAYPAQADAARGECTVPPAAGFVRPAFHHHGCAGRGRICTASSCRRAPWSDWALPCSCRSSVDWLR